MAGGWRPDPTGRFHERYLDRDGTWTDRVRDERHLNDTDRYRSGPDWAPMTRRQAIGWGLALWLVAVPAAIVLAMTVGLSRGFSGDDVGVLPQVLFFGSIIVGLLVTVALVVNQWGGHGRSRPSSRHR